MMRLLIDCGRLRYGRVAVSRARQGSGYDYKDDNEDIGEKFRVKEANGNKNKEYDYERSNRRHNWMMVEISEAEERSSSVISQ